MGFQSPKMAPGSRYVGWLALFPNCCTSYPVPLALIVLDSQGQLHEFKGQQATFGWCFERGGTGGRIQAFATSRGNPGAV